MVAGASCWPAMTCREQLADLTDAVQHAYSQYGELATLREPLKYSFRLTLTLVLLLAMLSAIYLAIQSAQRLTRPVQDLIQGTRAVGKGDFEHEAAAAVARRDGLPGAVLQ